ncbi:MoxR family ATPase [bacterium]|nr:MoxR family ATPase [bacterium]
MINRINKENIAPVSLEQARKLARAIEQVIRGKSEAIQMTLVTLLSGGHLLIEDVPGIGKTTLGHALAKCVSCSFHRIQFTSDLMPADITGVSIWSAKDQEFVFKPGPVFSNIVLADEINRATPKTQSALLEAMSEFQVSVDSRTYELVMPFMVIATQNPLEHYGTYPLPESQMDRFFMRIRLGYPDEQHEKEIIRNQEFEHPIKFAQPVIERTELVLLQEQVKNVTIDEDVLSYLLRIVSTTRNSPLITLGCSPRGSLYFFRAAQAYAFFQERDYVIPDDVKKLAVPLLAHRIQLKSSVVFQENRAEEAERVIQQIVDTIPVPI